MDIPQKITREHLPMLWSYAREQKALVNKSKRRHHLCAKMGHIAFHIGLAFLGALFSYVLANTAEPMRLKPWYHNLTETINQFVVSISKGQDYIMLLLCLGLAVVALLLFPFIVTLIAKIFSFGISGSSYLSRPNGVKSAKEEAKKLLEEVERIKKYDSYDSWDDYYPMNEVGDLIKVNTYNAIPALTFALSSWFCFLAGIKTSAGQYAGGLLLALLVSFALLLVIVPLWKLSSIINATLYRGCSSADCYSIKTRLNDFIAECEKEEKARKERLAREREAEEAKRQAEKQNKAAELYAQATQGEEIDMELMKQAADLGNPSACKEYGKMLFMETNSDLFTKSEKEDKCELAASYLEVAATQDVEAEFLWLSCRIQYEINDIHEWMEMLKRVRAIKASGELHASFGDSINSMIQLLVQTIDRIAEKQHTASAPKSKKGRFRCRYFNAGICNEKSNGYFIYKCTDPVGQCCSAALLNKWTVYDEY